MNKRLIDIKFSLILIILIILVLGLSYLNLSIGLVDSGTMEQIYAPDKVLMFIF